MPEPNQLAILERGPEEWNAWRKQHAGIHIQLQAADLAGADLVKVNLVGADLSDANLVGADLSDANLVGADLAGTKLVGAKLNRAYLVRTHLAGAQLACAQLHSADLAEADLADANFEDASLVHARLADTDLWGTDLTRADAAGAQLAGARFLRVHLSGTNFEGARLQRTIFGEVDLSEARGLDRVIHLGPSLISTEALYRSRGSIPEDFLRGCGVPENLIRSLTAPDTTEFYSCFVSYSHSDKLFARRLFDQLKAQGIRCWLDAHDMKPGDRILDVVNDAIRFHDKILLCCSKASLNSWWVKDEIRKAQERERREKRNIIIPLMVDSYLLDGWEDGLATDLRSRLAADFTGWEQSIGDFELAFDQVLQSLQISTK